MSYPMSDHLVERLMAGMFLGDKMYITCDDKNYCICVPVFYSGRASKQACPMEAMNAALRMIKTEMSLVWVLHPFSIRQKAI